MAPPLTSATIILEERVLIPTDRLSGVSEIIKNVKLGLILITFSVLKLNIYW